MKNIKIGYFADGPWSHLAFERIVKDKRIQIAFIVPRNDSKDSTLKQYAIKYKIDYFKLPNVNSEIALNKIKTYQCDLLVSMSFNQIFRKDLLEVTPLGIINCHAGKLPFYRGRNILNWALINGEKEFGITVHFVDEGIDTGDIILQKTYPITEKDDYGSLLKIAYTGCAKILYQALTLFLEEKVQSIPQSSIAPIGMYCGRREEGDEIIDWNNSSEDIFNFIRALAKPGPVAQTHHNGEKVFIYKAKYIENAPVYIGKPGQVLTKTSNGYIIKTKNSFIEVIDLDIKLKVGNILN